MHLNICHRKYYLQVVLIHSQIYTFFGRTTITVEIVWNVKLLRIAQLIKLYFTQIQLTAMISHHII